MSSSAFLGVAANYSDSTTMVRPFRQGTLTEQVVIRVRDLIRQRGMAPGDRLPAERELADCLGISRPTLRAGLSFLSAIGLIEIRRGSGTFVATSPPNLDSEPLRMLSALQNFTPEETFVVRRLLEVGLAGLAAENGSENQLAIMAEEVTEMYASLGDPQQFLVHDLRFHRAMAAAAGNCTLATLMEMVSALMCAGRRTRVGKNWDLKSSVEMHRKIYSAIRAHDADAARAAMSNHLNVAARALKHDSHSKTQGNIVKAQRALALLI